jgi:hypothetical protein
VVKAGITHDFSLSEFDGGNKFGLMATRGRNGRRPFSIEDARTIRNRQLAMGELTEAELPAEIEQVWSADDWTLGIGGVIHRKDPRKVAITKKVDISEPGLIRLAREIRNTTLSSNPNNFEPSGFAIASRDTAGLTSELFAFVGRDVYSGGDDNWTLETEPQAVDVYYQNGVQFGKYVVASARYGGTDCDDCAMVYIFKDPSTAAWSLSTLTAGRFKYFAKAKNAAGNDILWGGNHIFDTSLTLDGDHDSSDTTLAVTGGSAIGVIAVNDIVMMGAAGAQELLLVTAVVAAQITVVRAYGGDSSDPSGGEKFFLYQPHVIKNSVDPSNAGSWTTPTKIGEDNEPITGLAVDGDSSTLFIFKTDGVYSHGLDANGITVTSNLTTEFRQFGFTGNFEGGYAWNGHILLPMGTGGLLDMDIASGVIRDISMSVLAPEQTNLHGRVLSMHGDPTNLFMLIKDTVAEKLHLVLAKLVSFEGITEFRYTVLQELGAGATLDLDQTTLMIDTSLSNHRRVWIGFTEASVSEVPHFYPFGKVDDDKTDGFTDDTDAEFITVEFDKNLPNVSMHISKIELGTNNLSPGARKIDTDFRLDRAVNAAGTTVYQTGPSFSQSPFQEIDFPHGTAGKLLELRIKPNLASVGTTSPEITKIIVKWQIQPDPRKLIPMRIHVAEGQLQLNGTTGGSPKKLLAQLRKWDKEPTDLVLGTPNDDDDRSVLFLPGTLREKEIRTEFGRRPEYEVSFNLVEVG